MLRNSTSSILSSSLQLESPPPPHTHTLISSHQVFSTKMPTFLSSPIRATWPAHLSLLYFITLMVLTHFLPFFSYFIFWGGGVLKWTWKEHECRIGLNCFHLNVILSSPCIFVYTCGGLFIDALRKDLVEWIMKTIMDIDFVTRNSKEAIKNEEIRVKDE
jgi:hypothetical protein